MTDPRKITPERAAKVLKHVSRLPSVASATEEYKSHAVKVLKTVFLDYPTPTMGSLDTLFKTVKTAYVVQDLELILALRVGIAETVKKTSSIYKTSNQYDLKSFLRNFQIYAWWCQVFLDVDRMSKGAPYEEAA